MFKGDYMKELVAPDKYEYILDRTCVQYEPDHPIYIKTCHTVYDDIQRYFLNCFKIEHLANY